MKSKNDISTLVTTTFGRKIDHKLHPNSNKSLVFEVNFFVHKVSPGKKVFKGQFFVGKKVFKGQQIFFSKHYCERVTHDHLLIFGTHGHFITYFSKKNIFLVWVKISISLFPHQDFFQISKNHKNA